MNNTLRKFLEMYITRKIGVEIKCCLMFFMILCFYCGFKLVAGIPHANITHMIEMAVIAYLLVWVQSLIHADFHEVEKLKTKEWGFIVASAIVYGILSFILQWYDRNPTVTIVFAVYMFVAYLCVFLIYKIKRVIDAKLLNEDLKHFQNRKI